MTKRTMAADGQPMMWRYAEGTWSRVPDPFGKYETSVKAWISEGFHSAESWDFLFTDIRVLEHDSDERWRINVCIDGHVTRTIEVTRLPDLIDLLAKLATISSALVLDGIGELIEDFGQYVGTQAPEGDQK